MIASAPAFPASLVIHGCSVNASSHHLSAPPIHSVHRSTSARASVVFVSVLMGLLIWLLILSILFFKMAVDHPSTVPPTKPASRRSASIRAARVEPVERTPSAHHQITSRSAAAQVVLEAIRILSAKVCFSFEDWLLSNLCNFQKFHLNVAQMMTVVWRGSA